MNHSAIRFAYPQVVTINDSIGALDADGNLVELDEAKVTAANGILEKQQAAEAKAKATKKAALLDRLGITAEEAQLLLS